MSEARLADSEYMTDDELRLIAALTGGENQTESADAETTEASNYSAEDIWNVIKKRNTAIKNDISEIEKAGGDTAKYSDYLSWYVTVTVQVVEPGIGIPIQNVEVNYPDSENPARPQNIAITDSDGIVQFVARKESSVTLTLSDSEHGRRTVVIDVNTDVSNAEPIQIPLYKNTSNLNVEVIEEWKEKYNGHTYCLIVPDKDVDWQQAVVLCEELGGHLLRSQVRKKRISL